MLYTVWPVVLGGIVHMGVVRAGALSTLAKPIDCGSKWRGRRIFGEHKTWRGLVVIVTATMLAVGLQRFLEQALPLLAPWNMVDLARIAWWKAGAIWGAAYALAELPNSFAKRRMGIDPGRGPKGGIAAPLWAIADQADSAIGCALAAWALLHVGLADAIALATIGTGLHLAMNLLLYCVGLRDRAI